MENSKSKPKATATLKARKSAVAPRSATTGKSKIAKSATNHDKIRAKAQQIYNDRIVRGEQGTPEGDWLKAEGLLRR